MSVKRPPNTAGPIERQRSLANGSGASCGPSVGGVLTPGDCAAAVEPINARATASSVLILDSGGRAPATARPNSRSTLQPAEYRNARAGVSIHDPARTPISG